MSDEIKTAITFEISEIQTRLKEILNELDHKRRDILIEKFREDIPGLVERNTKRHSVH